MKIASIIQCLALCTWLFAKEEPAYHLIVNLSDHQVEYQLRMHKLRSFKSPFVSLIVPVNSLMDLMHSKFSNFLAAAHLQVCMQESFTFVKDNQYDIRFTKDFTFAGNSIANYGRVRKKYTRRIKRMYELIDRAQNILFIKTGITKNQATELISLLTSHFSSKSITLLVLDDTPEIKTDWGLAHIKNMHLPQAQPYAWTGNDQAWREIFAQFRFHKI